MRLHALLVGSVLALALTGTTSVEAMSQTQAAPLARVRIASLRRYFVETLKQPKYASLGLQEKQLLIILATSAATITDSGRCVDPSASGSAAEVFIFTIGILRRREPTTFEVSRKTELVELAMDMEAQRPPSQDLTNALCHGQVLPASAANSLVERRAAARRVLVLGLSPPPSPPATATPR